MQYTQNKYNLLTDEHNVCLCQEYKPSIYRFFYILVEDQVRCRSKLKKT